MTKSLIPFLQSAFAAIMVDCSLQLPEAEKDFRRDCKRLTSNIENHGIYYVAVVLPNAAKSLDLALSGIRLPRDLGLGRCQRGTTYPRLFKGLWSRIFDELGYVLDEPDYTAVKLLRQVLRLAKKLKLQCKPTDTWRSVHEFYQVDQECRAGSLDWDTGDFCSDSLARLHFADERITCMDPQLFTEGGSVSDAIDYRHAEAVQFTADVISAIIGRFNPTEWRPKHGPGAVSDNIGKDSKYAFPHWPDKLEAVFSFAECGSYSYSAAATASRGDAGGSWKHEPPSRLIAVPKTYDKPRLIASEPIAHQWCQQIIRDFIATRCSETFISSSVDFRRQEKNGRLALSASLSDSHATIDLSSASDRISLWLVERIFRRNKSLLDALCACRTRYIRNDIDRRSPRYHRLRKFTTMGSAVTFPCQTLIFLSIAIGSTLYARRLPLSQKNIERVGKEVRVFGDDLIVPTDSGSHVVSALEAFGLKVNPSKTFLNGKFKESCGIDAFGGNDVTPVHLLDTDLGTCPESVVSVVETHNNLVNKGLLVTAAYMRRVVERFSIPFKEPGSGLFGFVHDGITPLRPLRTRWNTSLHLHEARTWIPYGKSKRRQTKLHEMMHQYFTEFAHAKFVFADRLGMSSREPIKLKMGWVPSHGYLLPCAGA